MTMSDSSESTDDQTEACGRCAMTSVVDAVDDEDNGSQPFEGERIDVDRSELRTTSLHIVTLGKLKDRLDEWATGIIYDR
jgi:hypothetical protein